MNILEEFWYGNIEPAEYDPSSGKEYKEHHSFSIIMFVAGVCSGYLQQMDVSVVLVRGIGVISTIAIIWFVSYSTILMISPVAVRGAKRCLPR